MWDTTRGRRLCVVVSAQLTREQHHASERRKRVQGVVLNRRLYAPGITTTWGAPKTYSREAGHLLARVSVGQHRAARKHVLNHVEGVGYAGGTQIRGAFKKLLDDCQSLDFRQLVEKKFSLHLDKTRPRVRCVPRSPTDSHAYACFHV
jgi:hypothetical protein